ncbi:MAG: hypothetical protein AB7J46_02835 [Candidatus Altimarinota bacterium]
MGNPSSLRDVMWILRPSTPDPLKGENTSPKNLYWITQRSVVCLSVNNMGFDDETQREQEGTQARHAGSHLRCEPQHGVPIRDGNQL